MPRWLPSVSKTPQRQPAEIPRLFEIKCVCGHALRGKRLARHQEIVCDECGDATFVLPFDVYPQPAVRPKKKGNQPPAELDLDPTDTTPQATVVSEPEPRPLVEVKAGMLRKQRRFRPLAFLTPFRLVLLAALLILGGTGYWVFRSSQVAQAETALAEAVETGSAALAASNFGKAADEFGLAVDALNVIGRNDPQARWVQQMHWEATAANRLADESLFEILQSAEARRQQPDGALEAWRDDFQSTYGQMWMVFESTLLPGDGSKLRLDFPLIIGEAPVRIEIDSTLSTLNAPVAPGDVILAAKLKDCRFDRSTGAWIVELDAPGGFLWSDRDNYAALVAEVETAGKSDELLARQTELLGVEPYP